jgi:DNA-binding CsgD family transcriptional regulator
LISSAEVEAVQRRMPNRSRDATPDASEGRRDFMEAAATTRLRLVSSDDAAAGLKSVREKGAGALALGLETQRLLQAASVLGQSFPLDLAAEMFDMSLGHALTLLDNAIHEGFVRFDSDDVVFSSAEIHSAVYDSIPRPLRSAMHRHFGLALLTRGDRPQEAARHVCAGAQEGQKPSIALLDDAVQQLRWREPALAANVASLALELTPDSADEWLPRCVAVVDARLASGQPLLATELARRALGRGYCPDEWTARLNLALGLMAALRGDPESAFCTIKQARSVLGLPAPVRDQAQRTKILCELLARDLEGAAASAADTLSGDQQSASDATMGAALSVFAERAWEQGRTGDAVTLADAAVRRLDRDPSAGHHPRLSLAAMHTSLGNFSTAQACINAATAELTTTTDALWAPGPAIARARNALSAGRLAVARAEAESALAAAELLGTTVFAADALTIRARAALIGGDLRMARDLLARRRDLVARQRSDDPVAAWLSVAVAEAQDGAAAALDAARSLSATLRERPRLLLDEVVVAAWLTRVASAAGDGALAAEIVNQIERLAAGSQDAAATVAAGSHARAVFDRDPDALERAAAIQTEPWAAASAWEDAGRLHAAAGASSRARSALAEALARYQVVEADRDSARVRSRLRRLGVRRTPGRRNHRPLSGWDSLTESEQRVSRVIAEGLTTGQAAQRLFISPHTVDSHVRHSFRKLGISSRVEMTRIVLQSDAANESAGSPAHSGKETRVQGMPRR